MIINSSIYPYRYYKRIKVHPFGDSIWAKTVCSLISVLLSLNHRKSTHKGKDYLFGRNRNPLYVISSMHHRNGSPASRFLCCASKRCHCLFRHRRGILPVKISRLESHNKIICNIFLSTAVKNNRSRCNFVMKTALISTVYNRFITKYLLYFLQRICRFVANNSQSYEQ